MTAIVSIQGLIQGLSSPKAFGHNENVDNFQVIQTHLSLVFIVGDEVYKLKKAIDFGWADYSTLEKRKYFCEQEVDLNSRLAKEVYHGVFAVYKTPTNEFYVSSLDNPSSDLDEIVEYCVKMTRLEEYDTMLHRVRAGTVTVGMIERLAHRLHDFHLNCSPVSIEQSGGVDTIENNMMENFSMTKKHINLTVKEEVYEKVVQYAKEKFLTLKPLIERRSTSHCIRDTHGDLRLEHVYLNNEASTTYTIIDCIEFNTTFRCNDTLSDAAFLSMELLSEAKPDLWKAYSETYVKLCEKETGMEYSQLYDLFQFYQSYRAIVRAKVTGLKCEQLEVPEQERKEAAANAAALWNIGLFFISPKVDRNAMVLIGGLPGSGKSAVAKEIQQLSSMKDTLLIRTDVVRKQLLGMDVSNNTHCGAEFGAAIYSPEHTSKTYNHCLEEASKALLMGKRVVVDATFTNLDVQESFFRVGKETGTLTVLFWCHCDRDEVKRRIEQRKGTGDASDADWNVFESMEKKWKADQTKESLNKNKIKTLFTDKGRAPKGDAMVAAEVLLNDFDVQWSRDV